MRTDNMIHFAQLISLTVGQPCTNCPATSMAVIIAVTLLNIATLLTTITLLVVGGIVVVKRKGNMHPPTVQFRNSSKCSEKIYDRVCNNTGLRRQVKDDQGYQDLDINTMDDANLYATVI